MDHGSNIKLLGPKPLAGLDHYLPPPLSLSQALAVAARGGAIGRVEAVPQLLLICSRQELPAREGGQGGGE
jgi:hypothetical protein